jgi:transcription elongation factor
MDVVKDLPDGLLQFKGEMFRNGLLCRRLGMTGVATPELCPSIEEMVPFVDSCVSPGQINLAFSHRLLQVGDLAEVTTGSLQASLVKIISFDSDRQSAAVELKEKSLEVVDVKLTDLRRYVVKGDQVIIAAGTDRGRHGMVASKEMDVLDIVEHQTMELVRLSI